MPTLQFLRGRENRNTVIQEGVRRMWNVILVSLAAVIAPGVDLETLDGQRVQGKLIALNADRVVLETADGRQSLPVADLLGLKPSATPRPAAPPPITIDLKALTVPCNILFQRV